MQLCVDSCATSADLQAFLWGAGLLQQYCVQCPRGCNSLEQDSWPRCPRNIVAEATSRGEISVKSHSQEFRWVPALVSDCICIPNYCVSLCKTQFSRILEGQPPRLLSLQLVYVCLRRYMGRSKLKSQDCVITMWASSCVARDAAAGHASAIRNQSRKPSKAHTHNKRQPTNAGQPHSTRRKKVTPQSGRYTCS